AARDELAVHGAGDRTPPAHARARVPARHERPPLRLPGGGRRVRARGRLPARARAHRAERRPGSGPGSAPCPSGGHAEPARDRSRWRLGRLRRPAHAREGTRRPAPRPRRARRDRRPRRRRRRSGACASRGRRGGREGTRPVRRLPRRRLPVSRRRRRVRAAVALRGVAVLASRGDGARVTGRVLERRRDAQRGRGVRTPRPRRRCGRVHRIAGTDRRRRSAATRPRCRRARACRPRLLRGGDARGARAGLRGRVPAGRYMTHRYGRAGTLVVSLDFELHWGVRDVRRVADYRENLLGVRDAVPALLATFREFGIHATWATVGLLFFETKREMMAALPAVRPAYRRAELSPYGSLADVGGDERHDPFHFAPALVRRIAATADQEIGTHTFSPYYCLEAGQTT